MLKQCILPLRNFIQTLLCHRFGAGFFAGLRALQVIDVDTQPWSLVVFSVKFWIAFVFNQYFCFYSMNSFLSRKLWKGVVYGQLASCCLLSSTVPSFEPWILIKEFLLDWENFNRGSHYSFLYHLGKTGFKTSGPSVLPTPLPSLQIVKFQIASTSVEHFCARSKFNFLILIKILPKLNKLRPHQSLTF